MIRVAHSPESPLSRRALISGLGAAVFCGLPACREKSASELLTHAVQHTVRDQLRDMVSESRALNAALERNAETDSIRAAFERAALAWKRAQSFRVGPLIESNALSQACFWPARPEVIRGVLSDGAALDAPRIQGLGVEARGIFSLEYLLFATDRGERERRYALELSRNVLGYAERVQRRFGDGRTVSVSVEQLMAQAVDTADMIVGKFARIERAEERHEALDAVVEGAFSGSSTKLARALLGGTTDLYRAVLGPLVARASEPIAKRTQALLGDADAQLAALGQPLERAFVADRAGFDRAKTAADTLKHCLQVEAAATLQS